MAADDLPARESMDYDVVVVGAGPAGLAAAIHLKQLAAAADAEVSVVVVEKGSEVGAHILSGAVIDPIGLDRLLPEWRETSGQAHTPVTRDEFLYLGPSGGVRLPNVWMPRLMDNHGNFVVSLGDVCRWLGTKAEELGVEVYPGFTASEVLYEDGAVVGVATGDMGRAKDGEPKSGFTRGMELRGRYTLFAEGARGQLSKLVIAEYKLDEGREVQKWGIGIKELWRVKPEHHVKGLVRHSFGWPLDNATGGGSWEYHFGDEGLVSVGYVVHLNYANPNLSPFDELQRFKTHPMVADTFEGGERIGYGARLIAEGGWQSVPKLTFPGGALIGCAAGFVNVPRIKGSHNAILTGMQAAVHAFDAIRAGRSHDELTAYEAGWRASEVGQDLSRVRNVKPLWSKFGTLGGVVLGGIDMWASSLLGRSLFGTMGHGKPDHACLKTLAESKPIHYPRYDGKLTFDRLSSVFLSGTNHEEDQPVHLTLKDPAVPIARNLPLYGEPSRLYCPAAVYEVVYADETTRTDPRYVINAQNCVHCKTCDVKDPSANIVWIAPEGGGGPNYAGM